MSLLATYVDIDTFTVSTDKTTEFCTDRRVKCNCGVDGYKYGTITSSSYSAPNTTVNLSAGSDDLTSNLTEAWYGIISEGVTGSVPIHAHAGTEGDGGSINYEPVDATIIKEADVDDTPVNGATVAPVSSNWAYDHDADANAHHAESHTVASHSDTTVTGAELDADHSKLAGIEASAKDDQIASEVTNTPAGNIAATDVQAAINELDTEKEGTATNHATRHVTGGGDTIANAIASGNAGLMTGADKTKIDGIEAGAEVNNISDANATDLTDGGETTIHRHSKIVAPDGGPDPALSSDNDGIITIPNQPAFSAHISTSQNNVTGDGTEWAATGAFWTERFDKHNDFSNGIFTAPVTGTYLFSCIGYMNGVLATHTQGEIKLKTSNANYWFFVADVSKLIYDISYLIVSGTALVVDMDINDTAYVAVKISDSTKVIDIAPIPGVFYFMGSLLS